MIAFAAWRNNPKYECVSDGEMQLPLAGFLPLLPGFQCVGTTWGTSANLPITAVIDLPNDHSYNHGKMFINHPHRKKRFLFDTSLECRGWAFGYWHVKCDPRGLTEALEEKAEQQLEDNTTKKNILK